MLLNRLQRILPEGMIADASWLTSNGYSSSLRCKYVANNWLKTVARGVFQRPQYKPGCDEASIPLRWQNVVVSIQTIMKYPVIVGGRTALELDGYDHFVSRFGPREISLYGDERLPGWVGKIPLEKPLFFRATKRLFDVPVNSDAIGQMSLSLEENSTRHAPVHPDDVRLLSSGSASWPLFCSTPERAMLELLDEIPAKETFYQADMFMDSLVGMNPDRITRLLEKCKSIKVKRLFLWFADRHHHAWFDRVDCEKINLGSGKRVLANPGRLDPKYQITVPASFLTDD